MAKGPNIIDGYKPNDADNLTVRLADFFHWVSLKSPRIFVPANIACKAVMGYTDHTPQKGSEEVKRLRQRYGRVRAVLRKKYEQDLIVESGVGARATVDSADVMKKSEPRYVQKLDSARAALVAVDALIDVPSIPRTPEMLPFLLNHEKNVKPVVKQMMNPGFIAKLLRQTNPEDEDTK